jgi:hypothetical protein
MMAKNSPEALIQFFTKMVADDDCICIAPHQAEFGPMERSFLDGLRRVPAAITAPPGSGNPFQYILGRGRGRWLMIWVPDANR